MAYQRIPPRPTFNTCVPLYKSLAITSLLCY